MIRCEENRYSVEVELHNSMFTSMPEIVKIGRKRPVLCRFNTIKPAQLFYRLLKEQHPNTRAALLHSQFMNNDRLRIENDIRKRMTHNGGAENPLIVVASSVTDRAMDVDYFRTFTECATIPILLQVAGRLNRFGLMPRADSKLVIVCPSDQNGDFDPRNPFYHPFTKRELRQSMELLGSVIDETTLREANEAFGEMQPDLLDNSDYMSGKERINIVAFKGKSIGRDRTTAGFMGFPHGYVHEQTSVWRPPRNGWRYEGSDYSIRNSFERRAIYLPEHIGRIERIVKTQNQFRWESIEGFQVAIHARFIPDLRAAQEQGIVAPWYPNAPLMWGHPLPNGATIDVANVPYSRQLGVRIRELEDFLTSIRRNS